MKASDKLEGARAFYTVDRDLKFISASRNTLALWGKSRGDMIGKHLFDLFPFAKGGPTHEGLLEAMRTFRPVRVKDRSVYLAQQIDVEIYPVADGLQVSFAPVREP